jgi:hypothetical protein
MDTVRIDNDNVQVALAAREAVIINNALNEVCNALDTAEFSTRMGATLDEVRTLLKRFGDVCGRMTG